MSSKHFVLVHGACHGAWCWYKLKPLLENAGHRVTALDMAASGINPKRIEELHTLRDYSEPLIRFLESISDEKVILVGHSVGGLNLSTVMEMFPEKIEIAVFLAAFMPVAQLTPSFIFEKVHIRQYYPSVLIGSNRINLVNHFALLIIITNKRIAKHHNNVKCVRRCLLCSALEKFGAVNSEGDYWLGTEFKSLGDDPNETLTTMLFSSEFLLKLYHLSPPEDLELAKLLKRPVSMFSHDVWKPESKLSEEKYGSVKRVYVVCTEDRAIIGSYQRWLADTSGVEIVELQGSDHMPMLSMPKEVCDCLVNIAKN